jgi:putative ABC transport system permease protein
MGDTLEINARFSTGHVKVMTKAYDDNINQMPNDLALVDVSRLIHDLYNQFPELTWAPRIQFGGLTDAPDENGETKSQGPVMGIGLDLLTPESKEKDRLNLEKSLVRGRIPSAPGEALLSELLSKKLKVDPGDKVTLISSTMNGSMAFYNFIVSGTISVGQEGLDKGTMIADIGDIRKALDMEDAAGEILGFFNSGFYDDELALAAAGKFNAQESDNNDMFRPVMRSLSRQGSLETYVSILKSWSLYVSLIFIIAMSLVLWNAGLLGGLRRYGEVGVRLAMGEEHGHVYRTMITESVIIGIAGSIIGTATGLFFSWLMEKYGLDVSGAMKGSSLLFPDIVRARITPVDFYVGFIPGLISTVLGTMLAGIGIYKRQTARLFKELEA